MKKNSRKHKPKSLKKIGLPPGSSVYFGNKEGREVFSIETYEYLPDNFEKKGLNQPKELKDLLLNKKIKWINVNGLNLVDKINELGKLLELHPLYLEDILNTNHRPKLEELSGGRLFVIIKMMYLSEQDELISEHISLLLGPDFVVSFQETETDVFDSIRRRIEEPLGIIRSKGADYLLFALLDAVIDHYFVVLEVMGDKIEVLENRVINEENNDLVGEIQQLKRDTLKIRRAVMPVREMVSSLEKSSYSMIGEETQKYFRDLHDHILQIIENLETYRDMLWGLMELYMSSVSFRMNNVMKLLTIISTLFIPLTFIVGVYGMNFEHMPELSAPNGYFVVWGVMVGITLIMIYFFKRKKWL